MEAAREYKLRIAAVTDGLDARAERDARRVAELRTVVERLDKQLVEASDRHALTRLVVELAWESALELLWSETWITMRPFPRPDPMVKASALAMLTTEVQERAAELREVVQKRRFRVPGS